MFKVKPWLLVIILLLTVASTAQAALGQQVLGQGMRSEGVRELQQHLHQLGLLTVAPTGYFGPLTDAAVRQFQTQNSLTVDGLVGPLTTNALLRAVSTRHHVVRSGDTLWLIARRYGVTVPALQAANNLTSDMIYPGQRLVMPTTNSTSRGSFSRSELELMARLVNSEAKGEPYAGKVAVAAVVLNRIDSPLFPNTLREVVYQPYQFEPVLNGTIYHGYTADDMRAVTDALAGSDPTGGALFFYNPSKVNHSWMASRPVIAVIGQHVFSR